MLNEINSLIDLLKVPLVDPVYRSFNQVKVEYPLGIIFYMPALRDKVSELPLFEHKVAFLPPHEEARTSLMQMALDLPY